MSSSSVVPGEMAAFPSYLTLILLRQPFRHTHPRVSRPHLLRYSLPHTNIMPTVSLGSSAAGGTLHMYEQYR